MNIRTRTILLSILMLLFTASFAFAQEDGTVNVVEDDVVVEVVEDETITAEDLDVSDPTLLPDSNFYFFKNWKRGVQSVFTFNKVRKAELHLRFADEKLVEAQKLAEKTGDEEVLAKAIENYEKAVEKVKKRADRLEKDNPKVGRFLDKFVDHEIKRQKLVDGLVKKLPEQARERILNAQERSLERFADVVSRIDDPEKLRKRIDEIGEMQGGSKYKHFKNLEVLSRIEEKLPEEAKDAIRKAQDNAVKRLYGDLVKMSPEDQSRFKDYLSNIGGNELIHAEIINRLENEDLPEDLREKIELSRENVVRRIEKRLDSFTNEEKRDKYLRHLEKGDLGRLRVLNELEEKLPEEYKQRIRGIKSRAEDKFGERIDNLDEKNRMDFFRKMDKVRDARTFSVLKDLEERLPLEKRKFIGEMRERALKGLESEYEGARDEESKRRIIDRLGGDDPKHADVLRELKDKVSPKARKAIERALEKIELKHKERLNRTPVKTPIKNRFPVKDRDEQDDSVVCSAIYNPVCAANGKTYPNKCRAKAAGAEPVHKGVCTSSSDDIDTTDITVDVEPL